MDLGSSIELDKEVLFEDLGYTPHPGQLEVHTSTAPRRVLACGVRWGKSLCAAWEAIAAALEPRERSIGWIAAPSYDLSEKVFREIVVIAAERLRHRIITLKEHEKRLVLRNLGGGVSEIRGKSTDNTTSLLGEGLNWLVVDEAARMKPTVWQGHLSQRLIDRRGWALLISTPKGKGWFYEAFRRGQGADSDYQSWNSPSWLNPHLDRDLIEAERERLPERVFQENYAGAFIEGAGAVFRDVRSCATGGWKEPERGMRYVGGLDLARTMDYTVLVIMDQNRQVVHYDYFNRVDWSIQTARVKAAADLYNKATLFVDSTGKGEPVLETLRRAGIRAEGYRFTQASKAGLIDNLSLLLEQGKVILPTHAVWAEGIGELEAFEYSISDAGNIRSGAPSGTHDDIVIALGLACWHFRPGQGRAGFFFTTGRI